MAVLEYYAFEAGQNVKEAAKKNFRLLARFSFRAFIYNRLGYDPINAIPDPWRKFHDRVLLNYNEIPPSYFSVFREMTDFVVSLIQQGLTVDEHSVPDISVGRAWSAFWTENQFDSTLGRRKKHPHNYPDYFPQSVANPVDVWVYPDKALGEFRSWLRNMYIPEKFPAYLQTKAHQGAFPPSKVEIFLEALGSPKQLTSN